MKKEVEKLSPDTVNMLLNPKMTTGRSENRIGAFMLTMFLIAVPPMLLGSVIIRLCLVFGTGPVLGITVPLYIYYIWRVIAKIMLHEKERLKRFKQEQISKYSSLDEVTTIVRIHPDGAVEYAGDRIAFFVVCKNGNRPDPIERAEYIDKFLNTVSKYTVSIHILNMVDSTPLSARYNMIANYSNKSIAKDMFDMINYNKKYVEDNSLITYTVFEVSSVSQDRYIMRGVLEDAMNILQGKTYREAVVADGEMANEILNRTITSNVDFGSLFMKRYAKGQYYRNRIIGYDLKPDTKPNQSKVEEKKGEEFPWMTTE